MCDLIFCECFIKSICACIPSFCEWKTTTEAAVDGWKGLLISSSSFTAEKEEESVGRSLSVTLAGRAGSRASMGAIMQWDSRHSGFPLNMKKQTKKTINVSLACTYHFLELGGFALTQSATFKLLFTLLQIAIFVAPSLFFACGFKSDQWSFISTERMKGKKSVVGAYVSLKFWWWTEETPNVKLTLQCRSVRWAARFTSLLKLMVSLSAMS